MKISYGDDGSAEQANVPALPSPIPQAAQPPVIYMQPPGPRIPAAVSFLGSILMAGAAFFGAEYYAPDALKPSTLMGTYDARLTATVRAAELQQNARYENWAEQVRMAAAQNNQEYQAMTQAVLSNYNATYDRARMYAEATTQLQQAYAQHRVSIARSAQSSDTGLTNFARSLGRIISLFDPELGRGPLEYADSLTEELQGELDDAVQSGVLIEVEGWDTNIPSPDAVRQQLDRYRPLQIPPVPPLSDETPHYGPR
ncbi:hypothetical protein [Sphingobium sp.]|uniref:hypothetical protein n=1 Tax=Sphingobium sp. TaxID=1912891 RepID=UPI002E20D979